METNSKKMMQALPSFEDMLALIEEIKKLSLDKMRFESAIKEKEAEAFRAVMTEENYQINGKPPAVNYYENAYKYSGVNGEILQYREELIDVIAELERKKTQYDVYKQMHDMFRTLVFQEKSVT